jgi:hypothetical protein
MSQTSCLDCYMSWRMPVCGLPNTPPKRQVSESGLDKFHRKHMPKGLQVLTVKQGNEQYRQIWIYVDLRKLVIAHSKFVIVCSMENITYGFRYLNEIKSNKKKTKCSVCASQKPFTCKQIMWQVYAAMRVSSEAHRVRTGRFTVQYWGKRKVAAEKT